MTDCYIFGQLSLRKITFHYVFEKSVKPLNPFIGRTTIVCVVCENDQFTDFEMH